MGIKAIITGSTGMVGKAVLLECLESENVESILVINRKSLNISHTKLIEIIHQDLSDLSSIKNELSGFNACFHCMGVSSIGMNENDFSRLTFDISKEIVDQLLEKKKVGPIQGFISKKGTEFETTLTLDNEGKVQFLFESQ